MTLPLYRRVLGAGFDVLPARVRELHDLDGKQAWSGRASVVRGTSLPSRIAAAISGLPPEGSDQMLRVTFEPVGETEIWCRQFGRSLFRSIQFERGSFLYERVGPTTFVFTPLASSEELALRLDGFRVLGVPLPRFLHPTVHTFERERDGRYEFQVEAHLPLFGLLVRYAGWLEPQAQFTMS
jgi:Domain of unknown function (DUF4166)